MQLELTAVSGKEQCQEAGPPTQEQSQHGGRTASHADQGDQKAGCLRKAREELGREHVHVEGADVHVDSKIGQSCCCTGEGKKKKKRKSGNRSGLKVPLWEKCSGGNAG